MQPGRERSAVRRLAQPARRAVVVACLGFVALALPTSSPPVLAAPEPPAPLDGEEWPIAPDGAPVELSGVVPSAAFTLDIPPGWAPGADGRLVLDYSQPALVQSSAIGVSLNDEFVDAVALPPSSGTASVVLAADRFRTGRNTVRVEATIEVLDDRDCPDPWHPARVLTFVGSSRVVVPLVPVDPLGLSDLPAALEPVGVAERTVTVRMGPDPSDEDLSAAAAVLAAVRGSSDLDVELAVDRLSSAGRATGPDVLIGVSADLTAGGVDVPSGPGGILQIGRNVSSNTRLLVTGSTPSDVLAAARSIDAAGPTSVMVGIEAVGPAEPPAASSRFTLGDLGYPDRELVGPGVQSTIYGFDAPLSHAPTSMTVVVDAVRSASGDAVSGLSVFVNGSRVGTVHFDVDTGATSGVQLTVARDDLRPGRNFLSIEAEFQGAAHDCDQRPPDESVEISASTSIELVTNEDSVAVDLEDLPYLLRAPHDSVDLVVALPVEPTGQDLADAIDIAVTYGDADFAARVAHAGVVDSAGLAGTHVIALGEPDAQPLHDLVRDSIVATQADPVDADDGAVDASTRLNGVIEVVPNPLDPTRVVMLATGFDAAGADLAQRVLLDPRLRGELYGRATFIGGDPADPVLAPVLEPVRIERGERVVEAEDRGAATPAVTDAGSEIGATVDDGTVFDVAPSSERTAIAAIPFNLIGLAGAGAFAAAGGIFALARRRRERLATSS